MLRLLNDTPFPVAWQHGRVQAGRDSLTVMVKATFRLVSRAAAESLPGGEQVPLTGDDPADAPADAAVSYDGDWSLYKPAADVLVTGSCHAPEAPATRVGVGLALGEHLRKHLVVTGERYWLPGGREASAPRPFRSVPMGWEHAFGGAGFAANPVGRGVAPIAGPDGTPLHPLPLIEDPAALVQRPDDRPDPAGLGPVNRRWPQRAPRAGTFDDAWLDGTWPYLPTDFDWRHFQAAPADQQLDGYLVGDEAFLITHMHPGHPEYRGTLPGIRLQVFAARRDGEQTRWRALRMRLDTAHIDMVEERLTLLWRGLTPVSGRDFPEISDLLVVRTPLAGAPLPLQAAPERAAALLPAPEIDAPPADDAPTATEAPAPEAPAEEEPRLIDEIRAALADAGLPPEIRAIVDSEDDPDRLMRRMQALVKEATGDDAAAGEAMRAETGRQRERLRALLAEQGQDPALADEIMPPDPFAAETAPDDATEAAAPPADDRACVAARHAAGESLAGADLAGLDLAGIDLRGADLAGADLTGTSLAGAYLGEANLSDAALARADLSGASLAHARLAGADMTAARLCDADLHHAALDGAILDHADLTRARLDDGQGARASLAGAVLVDAVLRRGRLPGADLSGARLDRLDAAGADLTGASLLQAAGDDVVLVGAALGGLRATGARLPRLHLARARAPRSFWDGASLAGLDARLADLPRSDFSDADLAGARLDAADLVEARFDRAVLAGAQLVEANALRACFDRTDLTRADLGGGNFFECDFRDAVLDRVSHRHAIVASSRLERQPA